MPKTKDITNTVHGLMAATPLNLQWDLVKRTNELDNVGPTHEWRINLLWNGFVTQDRLFFDDGTFASEMDGSVGKAYRLYQAAFGHAPDAASLGKCVAEFDAGVSSGAIAQNFVSTPEFQVLYGENPTAEQFVTSLYANVLHRAPEPSALSYWTSDIVDRGQTQAQVLSNVAQSFENRQAMDPLLANGVVYTDASQAALAQGQWIDGTIGNDALTGTVGNDTINGGPGNDTIKAGSGNDVIRTNFAPWMIFSGNDTIDGGEGMDTVYFRGSYAEYRVTTNAVTEPGPWLPLRTVPVLQTKVNGLDGSKTVLTNIERIVFDDTSLTRILGTNFADNLSGTSGNDMFFGGAGNDIIDGGAGLDTAVMSGSYYSNSFDTTIRSRQVGHVSVNGEKLDGTDTLINVERVQFDDMVIALDIDGAAGQAKRLYQAAFNHAPDIAQLTAAVNDLDDGASLNALAAKLIASPQFTTRTGPSPDDAQFVDFLYHNVLHRAPEPAGLAYWVADLAERGQTREQVLVNFSESPENQAQLIVIGMYVYGIELNLI